MAVQPGPGSPLHDFVLWEVIVAYDQLDQCRRFYDGVEDYGVVALAEDKLFALLERLRRFYPPRVDSLGNVDPALIEVVD